MKNKDYAKHKSKKGKGIIIFAIVLIGILAVGLLATFTRGFQDWNTDNWNDNINIIPTPEPKHDCTADGHTYTEGICTECGALAPTPEPTHDCTTDGHIFEDGICTECGEAEPEPEPTGPYTYHLFSNDVVGITGYTGEETELVIPSEIDGYPVAQINTSAFENNTSLTSVKIPSGCTYISAYAFDGCASLENIDVTYVTSIGAYSFRNCTSLTDIALSDTLTVIGTNAFNGCTSLTSITFPEKFATIGNQAFANCTALTSVVFNKGLYNSAGINVGTYSFENCTSLYKIYCPTRLSGKYWLYVNALSGIGNPVTVCYQGTSSAWTSNSSLDATWNEGSIITMQYSRTLAQFNAL